MQFSPVILCNFTPVVTLTGAGRTIDLAAWLEHYSYNFSKTPAEADAWATANDWAVVGQDMQQATEANRPAEGK